MACAYCQGQGSELRRRVVQGGAIQFVHQCLTCGRALSTARARASIRNPSTVPPWDETLNERWEKQNLASQAAEQIAARQAWFREHNAYLRSPEWRTRRLAVMKRSQGICEGCRAADATQVHHLTYEHWKEEFLWELVAICDECHDRVHADHT